MSQIELFAAILGAISVWLVVKRNVLAFPIGILMVTIYIWIFYQAKLYSDMVLQFIYIFMQIQGWIIWSNSKKGEDEKIIVQRLHINQWFGSFGFIFASTVGVGYTMQQYTDASLPYLDAFTTMVSLTAQWWMNKKYLENWMFWIFVDIVYLYQYGRQELFWTLLLYAVFTVMATIGLKEWWEKYRMQEETALKN